MKKGFICFGVLLVIIGVVMVLIFGGTGGFQSMNTMFKQNISKVDSCEEFNLDQQNFKQIKINTDSYSVYLRNNENEENKNSVNLKYIKNDSEKIKLSWKIENEVLLIEESDSNKHFNFIGIYNINRYNRSFLVIELPMGDNIFNGSIDIKIMAGKFDSNSIKINGNLDVNVNAGNLELNSISAENVNLIADAGTININQLNCKNVDIDSSAGSVNVREANVENIFDADLSAGSMTCNIDCDKLIISCSAGSTKFETNANWIELTNDAGSVSGRIKGNENDYNIIIDKDVGSSNISTNNNVDATKYLKADVSVGSISINFIGE